MKSLETLYMEEREGLVQLIMDKEKLARSIEPDTLEFVQRNWSNGNMVFGEFRANKMDKVFQRLMDGPWDNRDLDQLYSELVAYEKLMAEA